jgi:hypothetical protein
VFSAGATARSSAAGLDPACRAGAGRGCTASFTTLILTMDNPPGRHMVSIGLDTPPHRDLNGVVVILASWVMDEARKLKEEQDLVI